MKEKIGLKLNHIDIGGIKTFYFESASYEKPIVLLHGILDASFGFRKIIPYLNLDWKIYAFDIPGFGKSKLPNVPYLYRIDLIVNMLYESFRKLDLKELVICGHSMGGLITQHLALLDQSKDKRIKKIILLSPGNSPNPDRDEIRNILFPKKASEIPKLLAYLYNFNPPELSRFAANVLIHAWNSKEYKFLAENTILAEKEIFFGTKAKGIKVPTLIISGGKDEITTPDSQKKLSRYIQGSKLKFIPDAKHAIHIEYPSIVASYINEFKG
jgi:pimeloyl-ACP methyl ester carboxylesterase